MCQELWIYYYDHLNPMRKVYQLGKQSQTVKKVAQTLTPTRGQRCYFKISVCYYCLTQNGATGYGDMKYVRGERVGKEKMVYAQYEYLYRQCGRISH